MMKQDKGTKTKKPSGALQPALQAARFLIYISIAAIAFVVFAHYTRPEQTYFVRSSTSDTEVFPLDEPNVTPSSLVKWATQAATSAYTLDFFNYQDNIDALEDYFTVDGYQQYLSALDWSGALDRIVKDKLISSAVAIDTAIILSEGVQRGVYTWRIQIPLLLTYQGASTRSTQRTVAVTMLVTRMDTSLAPKGIGVAQIVDGDLYV